MSIRDIITDFLFLNKKAFKKILENGVEVEHLLSKTNKGREPIYIEALLCQLLL
jgi:hypothetical protein